MIKTVTIAMLFFPLLTIAQSGYEFNFDTASFNFDTLRNTIEKRKHKITLIIDTVLSFTTCTHHGNSVTRNANVKLHFDSKKQLVLAKSFFSENEYFIEYFFLNEKMDLTITHCKGRDDQYFFYPDGISFECLDNIDGTFSKAAIEFQRKLTSK